MERPIIQFYNVCKNFGANEVLRGVSFRIFKGQVTTIIGKSGGGKSVLLKHIIGLLQPDVGEILLYGQPISKMKPSQINRILVVLHNADIEEARKFAIRLERELQFEDLLAIDNRNGLRIRISAGYAQAEEDSLIKEVLATAESKDSWYFEFEVH